MKYERIVGYVASSLWAIDSAKLGEIVSVLAHRASGKTLTAAEIRAKLGETPEHPLEARVGGGSGGGAVAVVPIHGTIAHRMSGMRDSSGGASTESIGATFRAALADASVGTILLDIDSPGGTVTGVDELASEIFAARGQKRIVALVNGMAASAAYWLAAQADEIVSIPSGMSGSIGVFTAHEDMSQMLEKEGVKITLISAGKHKVSGNPLEPLSDEERAVIQARVDAAYSKFVAAVARGRGVSASDVRNGYGEGRVLDAKDAKAAGLIDRIATVGATVDRLAGRSGAELRATSEYIEYEGPIAATGTIEAVAPVTPKSEPGPVATDEDERTWWVLL